MENDWKPSEGITGLQSGVCVSWSLSTKGPKQKHLRDTTEAADTMPTVGTVNRIFKDKWEKKAV